MILQHKRGTISGFGRKGSGSEERGYLEGKKKKRKRNEVRRKAKK